MKRRDELQAEIESFAVHFQLTPRESEIMGLLCVGTTRIKEIAEHLSLSPNTVNNHINSIFAKCKARSKSELLSFFLEFLVKRVETMSAYARAPKVLYVHDGSEGCSQVIAKLRNKGIWIEGATELKTAMKMMREIPFDIVSYCHSEANRDWQIILKAAHEIGIYGPVVIAIGEAGLDPIEALDKGLADVVTSTSADALYDGVRRNYVSAPFRPQKQPLPVKTTIEVDVSQKNLGRGGIFVDLAKISRNQTALEIGDYLEVVLNVQGRALRGRGQIVWRRDETDADPGLGVRFTQLPTEDVSLLFRFIHEHQISSFIPSGLAAGRS